MTPKEYLSQISKLDILVKIKLEEITELQARCEIGSVGTGGNGSSPTRDTGKQERLYLKLIDMKDRLADEMASYYQQRKDILDTVSKLDDASEIKVLYMRYFEFKAWDIIAKELHYTTRQIYNLHGEALQHLQEYI